MGRCMGEQLSELHCCMRDSVSVKREKSLLFRTRAGNVLLDVLHEDVSGAVSI